MATAKSVSFRSSLHSSVTDLIREVDWHCTRTSNLIAGIVSLLAAYTEEGVAMTPSVFICDSITELHQRAGMGEFLLLSSGTQLESAGAKILKEAAPLCRNNWNIYIERTGNTCNFGVFCGSSDPSSLTVDEVILDDATGGFSIIRIAQSATNKVEVRTNAGNRIEFRFNDDIDVGELNSQAQIQKLAVAITLGVTPGDMVFTKFVERLVTAAIKDSHGTLIAVVKSNLGNLPVALQDVVYLTPPIDLYDRFKLHIAEGKTAASVSRLQAASELVSGFICSDGITVFDDSGKILGYRAFIRNNADDAPSNGGARSRAYMAMHRLTGSELHAAFFRSQDGRTEFVQHNLEIPNE